MGTPDEPRTLTYFHAKILDLSKQELHKQIVFIVGFVLRVDCQY
jgi:hypothetical protein